MKLIFESFEGAGVLHNSPIIYELPIMGGLIGAARALGLEVDRRPDSWWGNIEASAEPQLCFWTVSDRPEDWERFARYKKACPRAKLILLGSDVLYYPEERFRSLPWHLADLYLDCTQSAVDRVRALGVKSELFFWSISRWQIDSLSRLYDPATFKHVDALGLYRKNGYRSRLFSSLEARGHTVKLDPGVWDWNRTAGLFAFSHVAVGTSSGVIVDGCDRSGKGFRDWIAPWAGAVLAYDDFPDAVKAWTGVVPFYEYGDAEGLSRIITRVKWDKEYREGLLEKQREWAVENTTDRQFERLFLLYGLV